MSILYNDQTQMDKETRARMKQQDEYEITDKMLFIIIFVLGMVCGGALASALHDKIIHSEAHYENPSAR